MDMSWSRVRDDGGDDCGDVEGVELEVPSFRASLASLFSSLVRLLFLRAVLSILGSNIICSSGTVPRINKVQKTIPGGLQQSSLLYD